MWCDRNINIKFIANSDILKKSIIFMITLSIKQLIFRNFFEDLEKKKFFLISQVAALLFPF